MRRIILSVTFAVFVLAVGAAVAVHAASKNPYSRPDGTWISISGTVKTVFPNSFTLDYGSGLITVEMDDGDRDADAYKLLSGDKVTVNGRIDDDFFEKTKIEASSVFVEKLGTYFYASPVDEEDLLFYSTTVPIVVPSAMVQGTVTDVSDSGHTFTVDTGLRKLTVDVGAMPFDPLDGEGYLKVERGDFVRVSGTIDEDWFTGRELVANTIVKLAG
jgi:uncharacterized protein YdeI (BOF family)